jgi:hypothetical protein
VNLVFAKTLKNFNIEFTRLPIEELNSDLESNPKKFYESVIQDSQDSIQIFENFGLKCYLFQIIASILLLLVYF